MRSVDIEETFNAIVGIAAAAALLFQIAGFVWGAQ